MPDDKKPFDKKAAPAPAGFDWTDGAAYVIGGLIVVAIFNRVSDYLQTRFGDQSLYDVAQGEIQTFSAFQAFPVLTISLWILSFLLLGICVYFLIKVNEVMKVLKATDDPPATQDIKEAKPIDIKGRNNERWEEVQNLVRSSSESMWRLAILEADIMLDDMLDVLGYAGADIGERLKQATRNEFTTLDKAWEAHKVRNKIAHEGSAFELTQSEANRIVNLYRDVFEEFQFI